MASFRPNSPLSPPADNLRHMTSNGALSSPTKDARRVSQHLRLGSRSPTSIPSSPTSIISSSSAIFERDIEPILPPSPPNNTTLNPHRIARSKGTEQLEHSVPSVLDSAAEVLATSNDEALTDQVAVVAPDNGSLPARSSSGFASPIGSLRSRSPSPIRRPGSSSPPYAPQSILGLTSAPAIAYPLDPPSSDNSSPILSPQHLTSPSSLSPSHPPSPIHVAKKRLSFMSYSDLLSSTPAATQPLASLTTCASSTEPPPHIPGVSGLNVISAVQAHQQQLSIQSSPLSLSSPLPGFSSPNTTSPLTPPILPYANPSSGSRSGSRAPSIHGLALGPLAGGLTHPGMRESIALLDNVGGEWERQGMGRGLEERLEGLLFGGNPGAIPADVQTQTQSVVVPPKA